MSNFDKQRNAISEAIRATRRDLMKAQEAAKSDKENSDFADWVDEATSTLEGLLMALETISALDKLIKVIQ